MMTTITNNGVGYSYKLSTYQDISDKYLFGGVSTSFSAKDGGGKKSTFL